MTPDTEALGGFTLVVPSTVAAGEAVDLVVRAVGDQGTEPFTPFEGEVSLRVDRGSVSPATVSMTNGLAGVSITLSAADGVVTLTATGGGASGRTEILVAALSALPGDADAPAGAAIPELDYDAALASFAGGHPDAPSARISVDTITLALADGARVAAVNEILERIDALVVGGITGSPDGRNGFLVVRVPAGDHADMDALLETLEAEPAIEIAVADERTVPNMVPRDPLPPNTDWTWGSVPDGGNWGLELCRVPQMWNLNAGLEKDGVSGVLTGIIDHGFTLAHEDLTYAIDQSEAVDVHGTLVAGIIAAGFDDGTGIDGVSPYARLAVRSAQSTFEELRAFLALAKAGCRVINVSTGIEWDSHPEDAGSVARRFVLRRRAEGVLKAFEVARERGYVEPLVVASAGDDSERFGPVPSTFNSPWTWAALDLGHESIVVVEAIELDEGGRRLASSNIGGHVSAPGKDVLSTVLDIYGWADGTSAAAAHVSGLASHLLAIQPSMGVLDAKRFLMDTAVAAGTNGGIPPEPRIDAFAAMMALDEMSAFGRPVTRLLLDIDDGTIDGNQRITGAQALADEDTDGDGGVGDGVIDMSDFRRWRDWYLAVSETPDLALDGTPANPKRDVNGNGRSENAAGERVFPRGDFNGDGFLSPTSTAIVPGYDGPVSDLDVLSQSFIDDHYQAIDLATVAVSGDITVDLVGLTLNPDHVEVTSVVRRAENGAFVDTFDHTTASAFVYTLPVSDAPYEVFAFAVDAAGDTACTANATFELRPGEDHLFAPICGEVRVEITLAEFIEPGSSSPLLVRAGVIESGAVTHTAGIELDILVTGGSSADATGVTASDGFFTSSVTLPEGSSQLTVFVTATDPATGATGTASASASALGSGVRVTLASYDVSASANAGIGNQVDSSQDVKSETDVVGRSSYAESSAADAGASFEDWSASASGNASLSVQATWIAGDLLAALSWNGEGSGSASTTGPFTQSYKAQGGGGASVTFFFDVEQDSVEVTISVTGDAIARVLTNSNGAIIPGAGGTVRGILRRGSHRFFSSVGGSARAGPPPSNAAAQFEGSAAISFGPARLSGPSRAP